MLKKIVLCLLVLTLASCGSATELASEEMTAFVPSNCLPQKEEETAPIYPLQSIDMVLPFDTGSGSDVWGQVLALCMGAELGGEIACTQATGGVVGTAALDAAWTAPHDGYTMLAVCDTLLTAPLFTETTLSAQDWVYYLAAGVPGVLWVNQETALAGYDTMEAVVAALEADHESLCLGGASSGLWYLMSQRLLREEAFYWLSYATSGDAIEACLSGKTNAVVAFPSEVTPGDLVPVAVLDSQGWDMVPWGYISPVTQAVPGLESQFPLMQVQGFALPEDADPEVLAIVEQAFARAMAHPEMVAYTQGQQCVLLGLYGQEAQDWMLHLESQLCWGYHAMGQSAYSPEASGIAPITP